MSTRCNVIIKNDKDFIQLYHHYDGYPAGVGRMLQKCIHDMISMDILLDTHPVVEYLCSQNGGSEWELDTTQYLHGDIEFLYIVDLYEKSVKCFSINIINNNIGPTCDILNKLDDIKNVVCVYNAPFNWEWEQIKNEYKL